MSIETRRCGYASNVASTKVQSYVDDGSLVITWIRFPHEGWIAHTMSSRLRPRGEHRSHEKGSPSVSAATSPALATAFTPARKVPRYKLAVPLRLTVLRSGVPDDIPGRTIEIGEGGVGV